ncbi:hypothetical protein OsJ_01977 [Oryza sativa Japonica Group]|uniref:Uncharacterized protein n=1 Tax=Oryza sativa subsp. japonica TaxID=39947 RepID=B9EX63_ORYSJ|nr:hypothetical protein OsJ_01977 [Oryza sativa Japonica Group]
MAGDGEEEDATAVGEEEDNAEAVWRRQCSSVGNEKTTSMVASSASHRLLGFNSQGSAAAVGFPRHHGQMPNHSAIHCIFQVSPLFRRQAPTGLRSPAPARPGGPQSIALRSCESASPPGWHVAVCIVASSAGKVAIR